MACFVPDNLDSGNQEEAMALKQGLIAACCHCTACVLAHPGAIIFPKLRYSKAELLTIRGRLDFQKGHFWDDDS